MATTSTTKAPKKMMRFRLRVGIAQMGGRTYRKGQTVPEEAELAFPDGRTEKVEAGTVVGDEHGGPLRKPTTTYRARNVEGYFPGNDVVKSDVDLVRKHGEEKFERLPDRPDPDEERFAEEGGEPDFEKMPNRELLRYAGRNKIDLQGKSKKDDVIARIREAREERLSRE